ncbi:DUF2271 domain-containing protein [candidate division KSB3 bacterium]|uniref:DUF2271 domain-containing protein n=1 Tax=candidate division KSB3 bacterium TaxID=2044937 RepID=A0A9D5JXI9_9BACT|nr:DUF2271 domain-containing protein [candidate division KSB3 bacterium]MBD3325984.1 DUF2271 domain-containing protein [candidate division KSB3 bacterium]
MMQKWSLVLIGIFLVLLGGGQGQECAWAEQQTITTLPCLSGRTVRVKVTTGEHWQHVMKVAFLKIKAPPQVAIWIEDREGNYIDTLFVTHKIGKQFWGKQPDQDPDKLFRPEALPYWMHKRAARGLPFPTKNDPLPDTVTAASPEEDFAIQTKIQLDLTEIAVLLEANLSFDMNETYYTNAPQGTAVYNRNSGQPALVYRAEVDLSQPGTYEMELIGHSSPSGEDGKLYKDLSGLSSALHMITNAVVSIE